MIENLMLQAFSSALITSAGKPAVVIGVFAENDPYGIIMAMMGMGIVFAALLLMYLVFNNTPALFRPAFRNKLKNVLSSIFTSKAPETTLPDPVVNAAAELSGEVNAAIAAAIHLYRSEMHDFEDTVLTIKKVSRTYSPWSSKIYGIQNNLNKN